MAKSSSKYLVYRTCVRFNKKGLGCKDANTRFRLSYLPAQETFDKYCK